MAERKKLEVTILPQNFTETQQEQARKNISAAPVSDVSSLSAKTITKINGDECLSVTSARNPDGTIEYSLAVTAEPTDTRLQGKDGVYTSRVQGDEGLWAVGLSGKYLSANALNNLSGNWENAYKAVSAYSGDFASWKKEYELVSTNSAKWDKVTSKLDASVFSNISGNFALNADVTRQFESTSSWATKTFLPVGDYLSASEKYLSANALDNYSGNWNNVFNSVASTSAKWNSVYETVDTYSGDWKDAFTILDSTSAEWNNVSAKLDKADFDTWSAKTKDWDISAYSGDNNIISINNHIISANLSAYYKKFETSASDELDDRFEPIEKNIEYLQDDVEVLKENSAHNTVTSLNEYITVHSGNNEFELEFLSGDLATKTWTESQLANFGGFEIVEELPLTGDNKKIYLIEISGSPDKYREWIVSTVGSTTAWTCIGDTSMDLTPYVKSSDISAASATWDSAYDWTSANSAKTMEVNSVVDTYSADWNEASAFGANSGKFVISGDEIADTDLAYVLKKTGNNVAWSGIDLSNLGKIYPITSITPDLVSATISTVNNIPTYVLSAKETEPTIYYDVSANRMSAWSGIDNDINYYFLQGANISGNHGISAEYDPENNQWDIGLRNPSYSYAAARTNVTTMTATEETLSGFVDIRTAGITFENDIVTLDKGLYHVDIQVNIPIDVADDSYYDVTLTPSLSNAVLRQSIDSTYIHDTTLDLSFDINLLTDNNALTFTLAGLPVGRKYRVENFQIHEVTTIDSLIDVISGDYTGGVGINVDGENKINVNVDTASGIDINANNQLYVKLGKGLKFDTEGAAEGTVTLDNATEEVVETVQALQVELEGKLTTNMNISDAKNVGSPFYNTPSTPSMGATLFTVPLNHKISTDTEISFFTSQAMDQSFPIMIGLLEYNFKYYDDETGALVAHSQTKWIADTGLIWSDTRAVDGNWMGQRDDQAPSGKANRKYTFKFKNVTDVISRTVTDQVNGTVHTNIVSPQMRSDRAYYLAFFGKAGQGMSYFLGDDGYSVTTNSDPYLSFYVNNMSYFETPESTGIPMANWTTADWEAHSGMSMSSINYWSREGEANTIARPLVLIKNNV